MSAPRESPVFFTDRDLGIRFPEILAASGLAVKRHRDLFAPNPIPGTRKTLRCNGAKNHRVCRGTLSAVDRKGLPSITISHREEPRRAGHCFALVSEKVVIAGDGSL